MTGDLITWGVHLKNGGWVSATNLTHTQAMLFATSIVNRWKLEHPGLVVHTSPDPDDPEDTVIRCYCGTFDETIFVEGYCNGLEDD